MKVEPQAYIEGPVRMIDVYLEAGMALERLPLSEQRRVVRALCVQADLEDPRPRKAPTGSANRDG